MEEIRRTIASWSSVKITIGVTYVLLILLAAMFVVELANPQLVDELAFSGSTVAEKPWTFVTAVFAHADLEHLLANVVAIWFFGMAVEQAMGKKSVLVLFLAGAFAGEILSLVIYPSDIFSIGASGGAFALLGAAMLVHPFMEMSSWSGAATMPVILLAILYVVYNAVGALSGPSDIAYGAHFAGLAIGLAAGLIYRRFSAKRKK